MSLDTRWFCSELVRILRQHGLSIRSDAARSMVQFLVEERGLSPDPQSVPTLRQWLGEFVERLKRQDPACNVVDMERVAGLLAGMGDEAYEEFEPVQLVNALDQPRFRFDPVRKVFVQLPRGKLFGSAADKIGMLRDRFALVQQRLLRNELFLPPAVGVPALARKEAFQLSAVEGLAGAGGSHCIFGMLSRDQEGRYQLEGLDGSIPLDLSTPDLQLTAGLFVENSFVLAEGIEEDGVFRVLTLGFPPVEPRRDSLKAFPHFHLLGIPAHQAAQLHGSAPGGYNPHQQQQQQARRIPGGHDGHLALPVDQSKQAAKLAERLSARPRDLMVFLSHVHLDDAGCVERLRTVFGGLQQSRPSVFVLMGNFTSRRIEDTAQLKVYFDLLADMIAQDFPKLAQSSMFVFVPGPQDPGVGLALPHFPLPGFLTQRLSQRLGDRVRFASNPCRLLYFGQEIVFFRQDCLNQMRGSCALAPKVSTATLQEHLVKTLLDQAHLSPMDVASNPVHWNYDHSLSLYPIPDVLVLGDEVDYYEHEYSGCNAVNPGDFARAGTFCVYYPALKKTQKSKV